MNSTKLASIGLAAAGLTLAVTLPATPAQALSNHTFVSAAGSDSNNCTTVTTPCRHFAAAYAATAPNGEIFVLDPANYGALTITGPVTIEGHGWASLAAVSGGAAITINAPGATDKINIIGVVLDGINIGNSTGIRFNSGGTLTVRDSVIRNFTIDGIDFEPISSSNLLVSNTLISDNETHGIFISDNGPGITNGVLNHVEMQNNGVDGLLLAQSVQTVNITVSDSVSANNGHMGIITNSAAPSNILVRNSAIANNGSVGLQATNNFATLRVTRSTITGNGAAWVGSGGGVVLSYGDNNIDGNTTVNTEPPNPLSYK